MLSEQEHYLLNVISRGLHEDDRRFCLAVQAGRPRAPKEYRRRWLRLLLLVAVTAALFSTAGATGNEEVLVVAVSVGTMGAALAQLHSPDRIWPRRGRHGRRRR